MRGNRWSHDDPDDPLAWHLYEHDTEGRHRLQSYDPLSPGFDDRLLASRGWVRRLLERVLAISMSDIYRRLRAVEQKLNETRPGE